MRQSWVFIALALALALLTACASQPVDMISCPEPRPELCTMEFAPTCAVLARGKRKEFASPCTACADELVTGYVSGGCSK
jgi:entry exclusion lipoprotein TrbK